MNRLAAGVYDDGDGRLIIDVSEVLADAGFADTPENRRTMADVARAKFAAFGIPITVEYVDDR